MYGLVSESLFDQKLVALNREFCGPNKPRFAKNDDEEKALSGSASITVMFAHSKTTKHN